jgi:glutathione synthase/RimK-type ligase-like ATP-grasp enzyme
MNSRKRVAVITCSVLPEPDPDEEILLEAIAASGRQVDLVPWDDPQADPARYDLCVLRSCWDYPWAPDRFGEWLTKAASRAVLMNPAPVVEWNLHKGYLRELESAGVPIIPSIWLEQGSEADLSGLAAGNGWGELVIKPAIGAGSYLTKRFSRSEFSGEAQSFLDAQLVQRDMLVQRFMPSVETRGERALVWIDGEFTHQVLKQPRYHGQDEEVSDALQPDEADLSLARKAMECVGGDLLYARVDIIDGDRGEPLLSELELIEPSLFLLQHAPALDRLVAAIDRRLA